MANEVSDRPEHALRYRPNVAAILQNADGQILVCERLNEPGGWQFPQGGLHAGELPEAGLVRELREELSLEPEHYQILEPHGPYRYLFPPGRTKRGCHGQEQTYFRLRFLGPEAAVNLATAEPEFRASRWLDPEDFMTAWLPAMKREVYRQVFRDFFGREIA